MPKRIYNVKIERLAEHSHEVHPEAHKETTTFSVDLRPKLPPIYDQGQLGSCTANALCAAVAYDQPKVLGSRLFVYYNERKLENDIPVDAGATLADGVKCLIRPTNSSNGHKMPV